MVEETVMTPPQLPGLCGLTSFIKRENSQEYSDNRMGSSPFMLALSCLYTNNFFSAPFCMDVAVRW